MKAISIKLADVELFNYTVYICMQVLRIRFRLFKPYGSGLGLEYWFFFLFMIQKVTGNVHGLLVMLTKLVFTKIVNLCLNPHMIAANGWTESMALIEWMESREFSYWSSVTVIYALRVSGKLTRIVDVLQRPAKPVCGRWTGMRALASRIPLEGVK
jgi:hypothetical protein